MRVYQPTKRELAIARWRSGAADRAALKTSAIIGTIVLAILLWPVYDYSGRPMHSMTATVIDASYVPPPKFYPVKMEHIWLSTPVGKIGTVTLLPFSVGQHVDVFYRVGRSGRVYVDDISSPDTVKPLQQIQ